MAQVTVPLGKHGTVFSVISMLSARIDQLLSPLSLVKSVSTDPVQLLLMEFHGTCQFFILIFVKTKISAFPNVIDGLFRCIHLLSYLRLSLNV